MIILKYIIIIFFTFFSCKNEVSDLVPSKRIELETNKYIYIHKYDNILVLSATCEDVGSEFFFEKYQKLISEIITSKEWKFNMISIELKESCMDDFFLNKMKSLNNKLFDKVSYSIDDNVFFVVLNPDLPRPL